MMIHASWRVQAVLLQGPQRPSIATTFIALTSILQFMYALVYTAAFQWPPPSALEKLVLTSQSLHWTNSLCSVHMQSFTIRCCSCVTCMPCITCKGMILPALRDLREVTMLHYQPPYHFSVRFALKLAGQQRMVLQNHPLNDRLLTD